MFRNVLGDWAGHVYSFSVFFMLIGALSIFTLLMGIQLNDFYGAMKNDPKEKLFSFRIMSIMFSLICGLSLLFKDLKALSYVSIIKIGVIVFILLVSLCYARSNYDYRRATEEHGSGSFSDEFPVTPTLLGFMKAMGSWQTAYLFHMGVSDMYFSLENKSYSRWSKVSRISCFIIAMVNVAFAVIGYLATADQLIREKDQSRLDICSSSSVFLSLYVVNNTFGKTLVNMARCLIVFILMASYPLIFYFLKETYQI